METAFMIFGLGFFLFVVYIIQRADEQHYERKMERLRFESKEKRREQLRKRTRKQ